MKYTSISLIFLLLSSMGVAYEDNDIDGVEDSVDECPDTPFDVLVNEKGCPEKDELSATTLKSYLGDIIFKVGTDISTDDTYDRDSSLNLYANYAYHNWDISISNSRSTTNSDYSEDTTFSDNDIYLNTGYIFDLSNSQLKLSMGTKIADNEEAISSRDNDYFASMNFNYLLNSKQDVFFYLAYTLSGDSDDVDYEDFASFYLGTGYLITDSWYSSLSYNHTDSIYSDGDAQNGIAWFNSYSFSDNLFATASYNYALEDSSYDHTFSLALGVKF